MWLFNGEEVHSHADLREDCESFVYVIIYENGAKYIGKKAVRSVRKKPPLAGKKRNRRVMTNLPFVNYEGSHEYDTEKFVIKHKIILYQCSNKRTSTYIETALLTRYDALFSDEFLNNNIGGTFYDNALNGLICQNTEDTF